jgi:hypothetical protein
VAQVLVFGEFDLWTEGRKERRKEGEERKKYICTYVCMYAPPPVTTTIT